MCVGESLGTRARTVLSPEPARKVKETDSRVPLPDRAGPSVPARGRAGVWVRRAVDNVLLGPYCGHRGDIFACHR